MARKRGQRLEEMGGGTGRAGARPAAAVARGKGNVSVAHGSAIVGPSPVASFRGSMVKAMKAQGPVKQSRIGADRASGKAERVLGPGSITMAGSKGQGSRNPVRVSGTGSIRATSVRRKGR